MSTVSVQYIVDDVEAAIGFYTIHLGFTLLSSRLLAFAEVLRGDLRGFVNLPVTLTRMN